MPSDPSTTTAPPLDDSAAQLIIEEQRARPSYRTLLQLAHQGWEARAASREADESLAWFSDATPDSDPGRARAQQAAEQASAALTDLTLQATAHARRMIRALNVPRAHVDPLVRRLLESAEHEITLRPLRAAQRRPAPGDAVSARPGTPVLTVEEAHIVQLQRQEQNAVAAAFLRPRERDSHLGTTADPETTTLLDAEQDRHKHALLAARYILTGPESLARHHAQIACDAEDTYQALSRVINRARLQQREGLMFQDGDRWIARIPDHDDPDEARLAPFAFHLDLRWASGGLALQVEPGSAAHLERTTGIRVGQGWASLARWIHDEHARQQESGGGSGRRAPLDQLIWRENDGHLRLRTGLDREYPGLIAALEALRVTLRPA